MKKLLFLQIILISSCAHGVFKKTNSIEARLKPWIGRDINEKIAEKGAPSSTYTMPNGNVIYTFTSGAQMQTNFSNEFGRIVADTETVSCISDYLTDKESKIVSIKWRGRCR